MTYTAFLERKVRAARDHGFEVERSEIHSLLHDWQAEIVQWSALKQAEIERDSTLFGEAL